MTGLEIFFATAGLVWATTEGAIMLEEKFHIYDKIRLRPLKVKIEGLLRGGEDDQLDKLLNKVLHLSEESKEFKGKVLDYLHRRGAELIEGASEIEDFSKKVQCLQDALKSFLAADDFKDFGEPTFSPHNLECDINSCIKSIVDTIGADAQNYDAAAAA